MRNYKKLIRWAGLAVLCGIFIAFPTCSASINDDQGETPLAFSISGRITESGVGLSAVSVVLAGERSSSTTTDSSGAYEFKNLSKGSYTVTPLKAGYYFNPEYLSVTVTSSDLKNQDLSAESVLIDPPVTKTVIGRVNLPYQTPLNPSILKVQSFFGTVNVDAGGNFVGLPVLDEDIGQIEFVVDNNNNPIMVAYVSGQSVANGNLSVGPEEMALGLVAFNPILMVLSVAQRTEILGLAINHSDFPGLVADVTAALIQAPLNALDGETNPHIYQKALGIGLKIVDSLGASPFGDTAFATGDNNFLSPVGLLNNPHIDDPSGPNITFVNPKMVFYGVDINPSVSGVNQVLLKKKEGLYRYNFPLDVSAVPATEKIFNLGDGTFTMTFYKGFNFAEGGLNWLDWNKAMGKASYANLLHIISIVLDGLATFAKLEGPVRLNDTLIYYILTSAPPDSLGLQELEVAWKSLDWKFILKKSLDYIIDHWIDIAHWIMKQVTYNGTIDFLESARKVLTSALDNWNPIKYALFGAAAINEYIPFFGDLIAAPGKLLYVVKQTGGVLSEVSHTLPPTAAFTFSPIQPSVGTLVQFDASASFDDRDSSASLVVRWDFNGDGIFDTSWSSVKTANYAFTDRGSFRTVLEVRDSESQVGTEGHDIYVASRDELKIVLTWGSSPTDLDSHLWTPSIEGSSYHVYYGNKCQDLTRPPYVMLDLDDITSYGPETIWFEQIHLGTYTYAVNQYSSGGHLTTSGATVKVIKGGSVVATFSAPTTGSGYWWTVFKMDGHTKTITPINTIGSAPTSIPAGILALPVKIMKED